MTVRTDEQKLSTGLGGASLSPGKSPDPGANSALSPAEQVDPELLALPAPPPGRRLLSLSLMACVVAVAVGLLGHLRADVAYNFASNQVTEIGDIANVDLGTLVPNTYVTVRGTPTLGRMVRYERAISGRMYAVFPLAGQRQVFVQVPLDALRDPARVAQGEWSGRLLTFGQLGGRFLGVREYLARTMGMPVTAESFVVLAEEPPAAYGWALVLSGLCLAMIVLTSLLMFRWFRAA